MLLKGIQIHKEYDEDRQGILDLMKLDSELSYEEARVIHATNLRKSRDAKFNKQNRCIISFFQRELGKYENPNCDNICIDCSLGRENEIVYLENPMAMIKYNFNYEEYLSLDELEQKKAILKILKNTFEMIHREYNWNLEQVNNAIKSIEEKNYEYTGQFLKSKMNRSRKNTAKLLFEWGLYKIKLYLCIVDKENNEIRRIQVAEDIGDEFYFNKYLGNIKWVSNEEVQLLKTNGEIYWSEKI